MARFLGYASSMYKRLLESSLQETTSSFLFGPRQTGKTTLLRSLDPDLYIDLLKTKEFIKYNRNPSILFDEVEAIQSSITVVVIDEIQRIPPLLDEVQRCYDAFPHIRFLLSGSSARKLKRGGANLLGGDLQIMRFFH